VAGLIAPHFNALIAPASSSQPLTKRQMAVQAVDLDQLDRPKLAIAFGMEVEENPMSIETIYVVSGTVAAFVAFAVALAYASYTSS